MGRRGWLRQAHTAKNLPEHPKDTVPDFPATAWGLPEEDQVLFLLAAPKEMDQLVEFLICLTDLWSARENHIYVKIK